MTNPENSNRISKSKPDAMKMNQAVNICGVQLKNPVIAASGTFGFGREYAALYDIGALGGISVKGLTLAPRQGNNAPRIAETYGGMLNAVGLQNPGVRAFIAQDLAWLKKQNLAVIANIAGNTVEEYIQMCEILSDSEIDMIELNISCPNVAQGGVHFGVLPKAVYEVTKAVKSRNKQPLIVKLTPNVADIAANAKAAEEAGADCLSLINTLTGLAVDAKTRRPVLANVTGGLSGPAIKPVALRMVHQVFDAVKIPIIGMGGILTGEDVAEFLICGASAVMVGTANIIDPMAGLRIISEFNDYLYENHIRSPKEITGTLIVD